MSNQSQTVESASDSTNRKLAISRLVNAPVELVYEVWTKPEHIKKWWGPTGFSTTIHTMEGVVGGKWELTMHGPDGTDYPNYQFFVELIPFEKIVYRHDCPPFFASTITFKKEGDGTLLNIEMVFDDTDAYKLATEVHHADTGLKQNVDKLEAYLSIMSAKKELTIIRIFDAPRELVFKAWTEEEHVAKWWSPAGFTNPVCKWDARPGGKIHIEMKGPDGMVYSMGGEFKEVKAPEKIVFTVTAFESAKGKPQLENLNKVTLEEMNGKTKMTLHVKATVNYVSPELVFGLAGMETGWKQSIERLQAHLLFASGQPVFTISREFNAPRELVYKVCTHADHLAKWWGPKGVDINVTKLELRPGGIFHYSMKSPDGNEIWGIFIYREIIVPERLVFVSAFSDKDCNLTRNTWMPTWPLEVLNVWTFTENNGKTNITLQGGPINATEEERALFANATESMENGFAGTFAQLEEYLGCL